MTFVEPFIHTIIRHFKITLIIIAGFTLFFSWQYLQQTHNNHIGIFSGFMVLMFGSIIPTRMFGMLTAISMVFALIGDFFVLPPLVQILKPKLPPLERRNNTV